MRVYLAASMTSPPAEAVALEELLVTIESTGHEVPTRHVASATGKKQDAALAANELARRDLAWVASCECLIAEVSTPSHGVGIEVMAARQAGLPILLLHRRGAAVSRLLVGLDGLEVATFEDPDDARHAVIAFLDDVAGKRRSSHGLHKPHR